MSAELFLGVGISSFLLFGAIIIGISTLYKVIKRLIKFNFYKNFVITDGKVKSYKVTSSYSDGSRHYFYYPVIEYYVDNKKYTFTTETGDDFWFKSKIGKVIKIKYDAKNPEIACKRTDTDTIWIISIGLICIITGSLFLYKYLLLIIQS